MTQRSSAGYIGEGLSLRGELRGEGELAIDARFRGEIAVMGTIEIGEKGHVEGRLEADRVEVRGSMLGPVVARAALVVHGGGRVAGGVRAERVALADGGSLDGEVVMDVDLPDDAAERR